MLSYQLLLEDFKSTPNGYSEVRLFGRFDSDSCTKSYLVLYSGIKKRYFHCSKFFDSYNDARALYHHYCELISKF